MARHPLILCTALIVFFSLISTCKKKDAVEPAPSCKFRVNGTEIQWGGSSSSCYLCGSWITNYTTHFMFSSSAPNDVFQALIFRIKSNTLNVGTYSDIVNVQRLISDTVHRLYVGPMVAGATEIGDFVTCTITSIKDQKYYDGTFTGRLTEKPYGPSAPKVQIEQGEFHNLKIH